MQRQISNKQFISSYFMLLILLVIYLWSSLHIVSDMSFFLSRNAIDENRIIQQYLQDSDANRLLFIRLGEASKNTKKLAALSKQLTDALQQNEQFTAVSNGQKSIKYSFDSQLFPYRYLISPQTDNINLFSEAVLKDKFILLLQRLQMILSPEEQNIIAQSPLNVWLNYMQSINSSRLKITRGVWFNEQDQAVLLIKTKAAGFAIEQQKENVQFIYEQIKQLIPADVSADLSGAALIALTNSEHIAYQIKVISLLASLLLAGFLFFVFRSFTLLLLLSLPLLLAVLLGTSVVNFFYGYIHGISLAFGITLIGIAVDYPLHYFSYLKEAGKNKDIILQVWPKLKLGLLTTLIGLSAITFSSFSGLNQLGVFAMSGLIAAFLVTRYVLPCFNYNDLKYKKSANRKTSYKILAPFPCFIRYIVLLLMAAACVYIATHQDLWENDLARLSPVSKELKHQDFKLRKSLNLPELRYLFLVSAQSKQKVMEKTEAIKPFLEKLIDAGHISYYDSVTNYIPSIKKQRERQYKLPDKALLMKNLNNALADTPFSMTAFQAFITALQKSKQLKPITPGDLQDSFLSAKINSMLIFDSSRQQWNSIIFLSGVQDGFQTLLDNNAYKPAKMDVQLIDIKQQSNNLIKSYRIESIQWFIWGCLFIIVFLLLYVKKISALPALLLPFSGSVIFTISLLLFFGYSLSVFHLVTLLLVVGLAIDYSIFIYSSEQYGQNSTALFSVIVCALSSFIMFFSLSLSSLPVLKAIGLTASLGIALAFILSLIFSRICKSIPSEL